MPPHRFTRMARRCTWQYCTACGLVALKNQVSQSTQKQACRGERPKKAYAVGDASKCRE